MIIQPTNVFLAIKDLQKNHQPHPLPPPQKQALLLLLQGQLQAVPQQKQHLPLLSQDQQPLIQHQQEQQPHHHLALHQHQPNCHHVQLVKNK